MQLFLNFNLHAQSLGYVHAPRTKQKISQFYFQQKKKGKRISTHNTYQETKMKIILTLFYVHHFHCQLKLLSFLQSQKPSSLEKERTRQNVNYLQKKVSCHIQMQLYAFTFSLTAMHQRERGTLIPKYSKTDHGTDLSMQIMNIMFHSRNKKFERYMSLILVERYERVA